MSINHSYNDLTIHGSLIASGISANGSFINDVANAELFLDATNLDQVNTILSGHSDDASIHFSLTTVYDIFATSVIKSPTSTENIILGDEGAVGLRIDGTGAGDNLQEWISDNTLTAEKSWISSDGQFHFYDGVDMLSSKITDLSAATLMGDATNLDQVNTILSGHTDDLTTHFTEASIDHNNIGNLGFDDHTHYIHTSPSVSTRNEIIPEEGAVALRCIGEATQIENIQEWIPDEGSPLVKCSMDISGKLFVLQGVDCNDAKIESLGAPILSDDAARLIDVLDITSGIIPSSVRYHSPVDDTYDRYQPIWEHFKVVDADIWENVTQGTGTSFIESPSGYSYIETEKCSSVLAISHGATGITGARTVRWKEDAKNLLYEGDKFGFRIAHDQTVDHKISFGFGLSWPASGIAASSHYVYAELDINSSSSWQLVLNDGVVSSQALSTVATDTDDVFTWFVFHMVTSGVELYVEDGLGSYNMTKVNWNSSQHPSNFYGGIFMQNEQGATNWKRLHVDQLFFTPSNSTLPPTL